MEGRGTSSRERCKEGARTGRVDPSHPRADPWGPAPGGLSLAGTNGTAAALPQVVRLEGAGCTRVVSGRGLPLLANGTHCVCFAEQRLPEPKCRSLQAEAPYIPLPCARLLPPARQWLSLSLFPQLLAFSFPARQLRAAPAAPTTRGDLSLVRGPGLRSAATDPLAGADCRRLCPAPRAASVTTSVPLELQSGLRASYLHQRGGQSRAKLASFLPGRLGGDAYRRLVPRRASQPSRLPRC